MNAQPYLCSNLNLFLFIHLSPQRSLPSFLKILLSCCLPGWLVAACLLSPGVFLSFFLVLNFFLSSLEPRFLLPFILFCPPALLSPLLPSYWRFSSLLNQSGASGRQGEPNVTIFAPLTKAAETHETHFRIVKYRAVQTNVTHLCPDKIIFYDSLFSVLEVWLLASHSLPHIDFRS